MYPILFIHFSVNGLYSCFHALTIVTGAAVHAWLHGLFEFWFSPHILLGVVVPDNMVALFLTFKGTSIMFSIVAVTIYIPPAP